MFIVQAIADTIENYDFITFLVTATGLDKGITATLFRRRVRS